MTVHTLPYGGPDVVAPSFEKTHSPCLTHLTRVPGPIAVIAPKLRLQRETSGGTRPPRSHRQDGGGSLIDSSQRGVEGGAHGNFVTKSDGGSSSALRPLHHRI